MAAMTQITPFLFCTDLDAEVAFFEILGFTLGSIMRDPDYAFVHRDRVAIRLIKIGDDLDIANFAHQMVYIDVDDIDALWAELEPALSKLTEDRVNPPQDRFYGQREFHVRDEGPYLIMFGQEIQEEK